MTGGMVLDNDDLDVGPQAGQKLARWRPDRDVADLVLPPGDPAEWGWPPTLALEIAMQLEPVRDTCESYQISREQWNEIRVNPIFVAEVTTARELLRQDGASFKARAGLQSLELLKESWKIIHDPATPHNVKADLIKYTIKVAGLDASKDQGLKGVSGGVGGLMINIHL